MFKKLKEFLQTTQMDVKEVKPPEPSVPITGVLMDDLVYLRTQFGVSADLTIRRLNICGHEAAVVTLEGMIDRHMMARRPLSCPSPPSPAAIPLRRCWITSGTMCWAMRICCRCAPWRS